MIQTRELETAMRLKDINFVQGLNMSHKKKRKVDETPKDDQKLRKDATTIKKVDFIKLVEPKSKWVIKQLYARRGVKTKGMGEA